MLEVDDELRDIKREIIESRGLVIKTNNLTNALSADIKSIAKRQHIYERRLSWNSATAYVAFVVVVFLSLKLALDARVDAIKTETEQKLVENELLRKEIREHHKRDEDRSRAELKAAIFFELVRNGKRAEIVDNYATVKNEPITKAEAAFFSDAVERAQSDLALQFYTVGREKAKSAHWQEAVAALEDSLRYKEDSAVAPAVRLALAESYRHVNRQADAIQLLTDLSEGTDKELTHDALYQLAHCQLELESWNDAKASWRALLRRFPDSPRAPEARLQLTQLTSK